MKSEKVDKSLSEVRQWREKLRVTCESMSSEEEAEYIHQKAQEMMQRYGLKLKTMDSGTRSSYQRKMGYYKPMEEPQYATG